MRKTSETRNLAALLKANRTEDVGAAASIWRDMTVAEQEAVLFELLRMVEEESDPSSSPTNEPAAPEAEETELIPNPVTVPDETEMIPKGVEELRALTASGDHLEEGASAEPPLMPPALTEYQSRWRRRWKWSVAVAAWAVTTIFAFTGDVSSFGPSEWVVTILATIVGGGLLVGTLLNFAVAAIPTRDP